MRARCQFLIRQCTVDLQQRQQTTIGFVDNSQKRSRIRLVMDELPQSTAK
jgi:hypothetical protein